MSDAARNLADRLAHMSSFVRTAETLGLTHTIDLDEFEGEFVAALNELREYYPDIHEPVDDEYTLGETFDVETRDEGYIFEHDDEDA
jgi:hypothetical protein